jgi:outer membrane scaffolding protein for murein synthesis (MipA/OmpV family)
MQTSNATRTAARRTGRALGMLALTATFTAMSLQSVAAQASRGEHGNWRGQVGVVAGSVDSYYGTDARRTVGVPLVGLVYKERLLIGTSASAAGLGGGVQWLVKQGMLGAALGISGVESRPEDHADVLAGMDDRSGGVFSTVTLSVHAGPATATASTLLGLNDDAGLMQTVGLQAGGAITPRFSASVGGAGTFANRKNMAFDFGITADQATRRRALIEAGDGRLRDGDATAFTPKGGLKELRGTAQASYAVHGGWRVVGVVSEGRLARGIADSPLARKRNAMTAAAGLAYGF